MIKILKFLNANNNNIIIVEGGGFIDAPAIKYYSRY
jgi:hypothetical protein